MEQKKEVGTKDSSLSTLHNTIFLYRFPFVCGFPTVSLFLFPIMCPSSFSFIIRVGSSHFYP